MKKSLVVVSMLVACLWSINTFGAESGPSKGQSWIIPDLIMIFVYVAPGSFQMGSNDGENKEKPMGINEGEDNEKPVHAVTISKGYWIGMYEVTQFEYQSITGSDPSFFKGGNKPVETVSWQSAVSFCQKLTEREQTAGRLPSGYEYRLPTEAQWEFAARGGNMSKGYKYSGSDNLDSVAWYYENSGKSRLNDSSWDWSKLMVNNCQTHETGTKSPNELNIYDMSGNVWEWCSDWYGAYSGDNVTDPVGAKVSSRKVNRGGSFRNNASYCRVTMRGYDSDDYCERNLGFRVAIVLSSK